MEKIERLKQELLELPVDQRKHLFKEVEDLSNKPDRADIASRRHEFDNKLGVCPHGSHNKYVRFGKDKGGNATNASLAIGTSPNTLAPGWLVLNERTKLLIT